MASPLPSVIIVPIATLAVTAFALISGPVLQSMKDSPDKSKYQLVDHISENSDVPVGGVRVIIINSSKSWEKAVKVVKKKAGSNSWELVKEVKCGDKSGSVAKTDSSIKFDQCRIDFDGTSELKFEYRKPATFGAWTTPVSVVYSIENQKQLNGRTLYVYFDNDSDGYFTKHPERRLTADKLF